MRISDWSSDVCSSDLYRFDNGLDPGRIRNSRRTEFIHGKILTDRAIVFVFHCDRIGAGGKAPKRGRGLITSAVKTKHEAAATTGAGHNTSIAFALMGIGNGGGQRNTPGSAGIRIGAVFRTTG